MCCASICLGADAVPTVLVRWNGLNQSVVMTVLPISHRATLDASTYLKTQSVFVQYSPVAARGCLPPGSNVFVAALNPAIRSPVDILMVITMASVWTVNSKLSWGCNYVMQWNLG